MEDAESTAAFGLPLIFAEKVTNAHLPGRRQDHVSMARWFFLSPVRASRL
jgi:hypothetical protein